MNAIWTKKVQAFKKHRLAIVQDDLHPLKHAVLVSPAEGISAETVNTITKLSGGVFFVALPTTRAEQFLLSPMTRKMIHEEKAPLRILSSVEARENVTTGISAFDRAETIRILGQESPNPRLLVKPGHIFPVESSAGGVLVKSQSPEAALDLVRACEFTEAALFVDLLNSSGDFLDQSSQEQLAQSNDLPLFTLGELILYRLNNERLIERVAETKLPTTVGGELKAVIYRTRIHNGEHLALVKGDIKPDQAVLTRVQAEFTFADVFGGNNPPTRNQMQNALHSIANAEAGVFLYLRRPYGGEVKDQVLDWEDSFTKKPAYMMREYGIGAQILRDLGAHKIKLLSGSQKKLSGLANFNIEIVSEEPIPNLDSSSHEQHHLC